MIESWQKYAQEQGPWAVVLLLIVLATGYLLRILWPHLRDFLAAHTNLVKTLSTVLEEELPKTRRVNERMAVAIHSLAVKLPGPETHRLLVIEDNADDHALLREKLTKVLTETKTEINWATSLNAAIPLWEDATAVLANANLPDTGGHNEVIAFLNQPGAKPSAIYTGLPTEGMRADARAAGLRVIDKNEDAEELANIVRGMLT